MMDCIHQGWLSYDTSFQDAFLNGLSFRLPRKWTPWRPDSKVFQCFVLGKMIVSSVGLKAFQVPFFALALSMHSTVGSGISSCFRHASTIGVTPHMFIGKERRRRLIEWVDKTSFTQLNKLFEIDASERAHKVLLSDKNLFALIDNPKSFIIPVFPHLASPSSAPQALLEEREKKRQEGMLRQVSAASRPFSSSIDHPPTKKRKKPTTRPV
ncbi:hypothetical protein CK203_083877 [Vitis vinifera]|uniref:Uncharacterized protein n=1 Tax=Vitis vinifera TaxID=29760 RepID=A0A438BU96_VITVI|nr:hypothetical protein CK203_083877 [Vitis vinifera]